MRYGDGDTEELELDECRALLISVPWYIMIVVDMHFFFRNDHGRN